MEENGNVYQFQRDKLFRHRVYLKKSSSYGKVLGAQIHWIPPEETYDNLGRICKWPEYFVMQRAFSDKCRQLDLPFHNAIAFWNEFFRAYPQLPNEDQYSLILFAVCNYGDFFKNASTRALPESLVCLEDLDTLKEQPSEDFKKDIFNQVNHVTMNLPELEQSTAGFDEFRNVWNFQLHTARLYHQWKMRYDQLKVEPSCFDEPDSLDKLRPLVRIFRQYIYLLNEFKNSARYPDFEPYYKEFEEGKTNALFYSFGQILSLLREHEDLALIAPMYVLGIFQKLTVKLYNGLSQTSLTQLKIKLNISSNVKPQPYDCAQSNIKVPRNIQIIIYQILCKYFQKSTLLKVSCDLALCNHILQSNISLIGQRYFKIDNSHVDNIIDFQKCYHITDFEQSDKWVHFLLGEVDKRLRYSLPLYPDSIPRISFTDQMPPHHRKIVDQAKKLVDDNFVKQYLAVFVLPPAGLGNPRLSENVQVELADLMDQTLTKANLSPNAFDPAYARKLLAYETGFHEACADKIYDLYYGEIHRFLYDFLQSATFSRGYMIPGANRYHRGQGNDATDWSATPHTPKKLNIINRSDFETEY